jgi:putative membrane protein
MILFRQIDYHEEAKSTCAGNPPNKIFRLAEQKWSMRKPENAIYIIGILHVVGMFGLNSAFRDFFSLLTPVNLLVAASLLFYSSSGITRGAILGIVIAFVCGFGIEWIGVNTGFPFGRYEYGTVLGPKIGNTPLLIGVNWAMLATSVMLTARLFSKNTLVIGLCGGLLMTLLDLLIEPVAIKTGMWHWFGLTPPFQNYVAWFVIAFTLITVLHKIAPQLKNPAATGFFTIQVVFFLVMNLTR